MEVIFFNNLVFDALNGSTFAQVGQVVPGLQTLYLLPHGPWEMKIFPKEAISVSGDGLPSEIAPKHSFITSEGQHEAQTQDARLLCSPGIVIMFSSASCSEESGPWVKGQSLSAPPEGNKMAKQEKKDQLSVLSLASLRGPPHLQHGAA